MRKIIALSCLAAFTGLFSASATFAGQKKACFCSKKPDPEERYIALNLTEEECEAKRQEKNVCFSSKPPVRRRR